MSDLWQSQPPVSDQWNPNQEARFITSTPPKIPTKTILIVVSCVILLGGVGSITFMIANTTRTLNKAAERQNQQIKSLLEETNQPSTSFNLVGQVQAQRYDNPMDPDVSYANPFSNAQNPFR